MFLVKLTVIDKETHMDLFRQGPTYLNALLFLYTPILNLRFVSGNMLMSP